MPHAPCVSLQTPDAPGTDVWHPWPLAGHRMLPLCRCSYRRWGFVCCKRQYWHSLHHGSIWPSWPTSWSLHLAVGMMSSVSYNVVHQCYPYLTTTRSLHMHCLKWWMVLWSEKLAVKQLCSPVYMACDNDCHCLTRSMLVWLVWGLLC